jgi:hypothetical protein
MAINDRPDVRCDYHHRFNEKTPAAVAFVGQPDDERWWPICEAHIRRAEADPALVLVAYLDPTRQRRPNPDDDHSRHRADRIHNAPIDDPAP